MKILPSSASGTYLLLTLVLWAMLPGYDLWLRYMTRPEKLFNNFSEEIFRLETAIDRKTVQLSSILKTARPEVWEQQITGHQDGFDLSVFLYRNDSLLWWNSQKEVFPSGFPNCSEDGFHAMLIRNGWFCFRKAKAGDFTLVSGLLVREEYAVTNAYLPEKFGDGFSLSEVIKLNTIRGGYEVHSAGGRYLFTLQIPSPQETRNLYTLLERPFRSFAEGTALLIFGLANLFLFLFLWKVFRGRISQKRNGETAWTAMLLLLLMIRFFQCFLSIPNAVYQTKMFSPGWYSSSELLSSPGDLFLNLLILLFITIILLRYELFDTPTGKRPVNFVRLTFWMVVLLMVQVVSTELVRGLIRDSSFPFDFQNIAAFLAPSYVGLAILLVINLFSFTASLAALKRLFHPPVSVITLVAIAAVTLVLYLILWFSGILSQSVWAVVNFALWLPFYYLILRPSGRRFSLQSMLWLILFFSLGNTMVIRQANQNKTDEKIRLLSTTLVSGHNPVTEDRFERLSAQLSRDRELIRMAGTQHSLQNGDSLNRYLRSRYFREYWQRYNIQATLCTRGLQLSVQPQGFLVDCASYFTGLLSEYGKPTSVRGFTFLDFGFGQEYYLAEIPVNGNDSTGKPGTVLYLEFSGNGETSMPGYPRLLLDQDRSAVPGFQDYSYAIYRKGDLARSFGTVTYPLSLGPEGDAFGHERHNLENRVKFYYFRTDAETELLIGLRYNFWWSLLTPFSYLFLIHAIGLVIVTGTLMCRREYRLRVQALRSRLPMIMTGLIVITMLVIGIIQLVYIIRINDQKNVDSLREKAFSVRTEIQHKAGQMATVAQVKAWEPENFLIKLSNVFFTDLNFYDPGGMLIASSRIRIFREGLIPERINPEAVSTLSRGAMPYCILKENIGTLSFSSAYLPMFNDEGTLLGYLHLPGFSRQDELRREVADFLVTFLNIYIVLILAGAFLGIIISNYITAPFVMLSERMKALTLDRKNERLTWKNRDETGSLIDAYNRMLEELEKSASRLAQSERESAWRTMARQVAHEIKNPLTPMKLSAQHLERAWKEGAGDMDRRIERFTRTLVDQIDALAAIASDFSAMARMPQPEPELFDLAVHLRDLASWYPDTPGITYQWDIIPGNYPIFADRGHITRMVTNLVNNAGQSIPDERKGFIRIGLSPGEDDWILTIEDNGEGIPAERADKVFQPEFTTRLGGMGLGLSIVRGIVEEMRGTVSFVSELAKGSCFTVRIPKYRERQNVD